MARRSGHVGWCVVAAGMALPSGWGMAREVVAADTAIVRVEEVVVTALRGRERLSEIPAASFVFSREQIRNSGVSRLSSLLLALPGIHGYLQNSNGDVGVVDPRGFTANGERSYLKMLVNGHDVRDVENGAVDWDWLQPEDVEQIEVVEGPGAWVYGDGAEGGIVNIVRPAVREGFHPDLGMRVGSFGLWSGSLAVAGERSPAAGSVRGAWRRVDGWRDRSRERVYSGGAEARWRFGPRTSLVLDGLWLDADRQDPGAITPDQIAADRTQADTQTDFTRSRRLLLGAPLTFARAEGSEWRFGPYFRHEDMEQVRTLFTHTFLAQSKLHPTRAWTAGAELGWRGTLRLGERMVRMFAGSQAEQSRLESFYYDYPDGVRGDLRSDSESRRTAGSVFVDASVPLASTTRLRLGFRQDGIRFRAEHRREGTESPDRTLWAGSPFAALTQEIGRRASVYASYGAAFRVPSLNQLFDRRPVDFSGTTFYLSNPALEAQRAHSVEVGGRWDGVEGSYAMLTLYSIRVRNEIDFDPGTFTYANIDRSWHRGVQIALFQPWGDALTAQASGAYAPTTIRGGEHDGNQINAVPLGTTYGSLRWSGSENWFVEAGVRYVGHQYLDKANRHRLSDFASVDVAGSLRVGRLRTVLRIGNLLDRSYQDTGYLLDLGFLSQERLSPAAGRNITVSFSAEWPPAVPTAAR